MTTTKNLEDKIKNGEAFVDVFGNTVELETSNLVTPTTEQRITMLEKNLKTVVKGMNDWNNILKRVIANTNEIYPQIDLNYNDNKIHIRASRHIINSTSIIYVLPTENIVRDDKSSLSCQLVVHHGMNTSTTMAIVKEDYNGNLVELETGDIVANRLAMFRTAPNNNSKIILVNSSVYGRININELTAVHATFLNNPEVIVDGKAQQILSSKQGIDLIDDLDARYQKKLVVSKTPINDYVGTLEAGQLYVQVDEE